MVLKELLTETVQSRSYLKKLFPNQILTCHLSIYISSYHPDFKISLQVTASSYSCPKIWLFLHINICIHAHIHKNVSTTTLTPQQDNFLNMGTKCHNLQKKNRSNKIKGRKWPHIRFSPQTRRENFNIVRAKNVDTYTKVVNN